MQMETVMWLFGSKAVAKQRPGYDALHGRIHSVAVHSTLLPPALAWTKKTERLVTVCT
jgi:hypothetical protein